MFGDRGRGKVPVQRSEGARAGRGGGRFAVAICCCEPSHGAGVYVDLDLLDCWWWCFCCYSCCSEGGSQGEEDYIEGDDNNSIKNNSSSSSREEGDSDGDSREEDAKEPLDSTSDDGGNDGDTESQTSRGAQGRGPLADRFFAFFCCHAE